MNARRVYQTPELIPTILGFVDDSNYWKVLTLEKSFFPQAVEVLWRNVDYQVARKLLRRRTRRNQIYKQSIRQITLRDSDLPRDEASQMKLIKSLKKSFPGVIKAQRITSSRKGKRRYDWIMQKRNDGQYEVDIQSQLALMENSTLTREMVNTEYPGFEINRKFEVTLGRPTYDPQTGRMRATINQPDTLKNKCIRYLTDQSRRAPTICAIRTSNVFLELNDLEKICSFSHEDHLPFREIEYSNLQFFELGEFESFCLNCGGNQSELEVLILDQAYASRLRLNQIDRVIELILQCFPNLQYLEIPFTIMSPQGNATQGNANRLIPVSSIPIIQNTINQMEKLEKVVINIFGNSMGGPDTRYPFPIEDVAQNLACLGANENCKYELRNKSDVFIGTNMSRRLDEQVHKYQRLAPDGLIHLHAQDVPPAYDAV